MSLPTLLFLIMPGLPPATMIGTGACMLVTFGCLCLALARTNGRSGAIWALAGLFLGAFALGAICVQIDQKRA
jgi:hypothetical protein